MRRGLGPAAGEPWLFPKHDWDARPGLPGPFEGVNRCNRADPGAWASRLEPIPFATSSLAVAPPARTRFGVQGCPEPSRAAGLELG